VTRIPPTPLVRADETLPAACGWRELCRVFGIKRSRFYVLEAEGAFDFLKLHPPVGPRRYSGEKLTRYLRGDVVGFGPGTSLASRQRRQKVG
jgi:hypothetical protein